MRLSAFAGAATGSASANASASSSIRWVESPSPWRNKRARRSAKNFSACGAAARIRWASLSNRSRENGGNNRLSGVMISGVNPSVSPVIRAAS
jgi:hypothetical protein